MGRPHDRRHGIMLVAISAVLWSTAGLFVRMAHLDTWTIVFWRSLFAALTLGIMAVVRNRGGPVRAFSGFGRADAATIVLTVGCTISYVLALRLTTVANVMTVYATLPFIATSVAFVWVGERVTGRFLVAGAFALAGIAVTAGAVATSRDLAGILAALVMTAGFATQLVNAKRRRSTDMVGLIALSAVVCIPVAAPFMRFDMPAPSQLLACALYGVLTTGLAYVLALQGGRLIPSGEAGLVSMLDVVLGPFWVWLVYAEQPTFAVMAGAAIVLGSVLWYLSTSRSAAAQAP